MSGVVRSNSFAFVGLGHGYPSRKRLLPCSDGAFVTILYSKDRFSTQAAQLNTEIG
jgi:hypothetical protein